MRPVPFDGGSRSEAVLATEPRQNGRLAILPHEGLCPLAVRRIVVDPDHQETVGIDIFRPGVASAQRQVAGLSNY